MFKGAKVTPFNKEALDALHEQKVKQDEEDKESVASSAVDSARTNDTKGTTNYADEGRQAMKEKIMAEVLNEVMPDIGTYDVDGMVDTRYIPTKSKCIRWLLICGCLDLPLHDAVMTGSLKHIQKAVNKIRYDKIGNAVLINQYDQKGQTPLSLACKICIADNVECLLEGNALPDIGDEPTGRTPLMFATLCKNHEIMKQLIQNGASVDMSDYQCITPLMLACSKNDLVAVKILCGRLAEVDDQDENGWTPLHYCAQVNASKIIKYLLTEEGANRGLKDWKKRKPLDIAKFLGHGSCIASLASQQRFL